jgi:hypothetical protein
LPYPIPARRKAIDGFRAALPKGLAAAVPDVEDVVTRLYESRVVMDEIPSLDPRIGAAEDELATVVAHLDRLSAAGNNIAPGMVAAGLETRCLELIARIQQLRQAGAETIAAGIRADVSAALAGDDLGALDRLAASIRADAQLFPPGLADRLTSAVSDALADSDPIVWSNVIQTLTAQPPTGREFA